MPDQATPAASPVVAGAAPYGVGVVKLPSGLSPSQIADELFFMPDDVAGLPQRQVTSDGDSATIIYAIDEGVPTPRFGMVVVLKVTPSADADTTVANLERDRWGDPKDHDLTAAGPGTPTDPAFREFSRSFPPGLFLLPNRPVFFLLWYRANDEYAFMVIGDNPTVREGLARAVAGVLSEE
ncbi:MAG: hypothetical protein QOF01_2327 [Thermomicrobiales bacterium]|jgi:hypothetical protein|nr:hypothetical protein [Thermomicrobiales bacterium]